MSSAVAGTTISQVVVNGRGRGRGRGCAGASPLTISALRPPEGASTASIRPMAGRGRGRTRVNWSGETVAASGTQQAVVTEQACPVATSPSAAPASAWQQLEFQLFGIDGSGSAGHDPDDISEMSLRWEPPERDCYMKLANLSKASSTIATFG